eukprot:gnl/Dysnectes_brevis/6034_a9066_348.p1 GENE.gnl/Dysnectes_brevis/6034_a9066_348~~gnl/Dysnectes_brevis/6034_a9066_348.p1  ORF type:complete len:216 (+),score=21.81 gnl/Dysnectes_brevis/6034_a9066_348:73-720(+)
MSDSTRHTRQRRRRHRDRGSRDHRSFLPVPLSQRQIQQNEAIRDRKVEVTPWARSPSSSPPVYIMPKPAIRKRPELEPEVEELQHQRTKKALPPTITSAAGPAPSPHGLAPGLHPDDAMLAAYSASGRRIPRRGEIGWTGLSIERLEKQGFVMSGSRNARMTAARLKRESEVFNAERQYQLARNEMDAQRKRQAQTVERLARQVKRRVGSDLGNE